MANTTYDFELSAMQRAMVRRAEHDEIVFLVRAAASARFDVMHVDERGVAAAGNRAAPMVAAHDFAAESWRNGLDRALRFTHVGLAASVVRTWARLSGEIFCSPVRLVGAHPLVGLVGRIAHNNAGRVDCVAGTTGPLTIAIVRTHINRRARYPPDVLRVTARHLDNSVVYGNHLAPSVLRRPTTALAEVQRD